MLLMTRGSSKIMGDVLLLLLNDELLCCVRYRRRGTINVLRAASRYQIAPFPDKYACKLRYRACISFDVLPRHGSWQGRRLVLVWKEA